LILKIDATLAEHRYDRITEDLQSHDSNYHLAKYKNRTDADVEEYIGVFEDMASFIKDNVITAKMAYDHFSYDIEKAWCNATVQEVIRKARATDKSKTAQTNPAYGNFERLAKQYLDDEGQSRKDLDLSITCDFPVNFHAGRSRLEHRIVHGPNLVKVADRLGEFDRRRVCAFCWSGLVHRRQTASGSHHGGRRQRDCCHEGSRSSGAGTN
jgi:hypothetical protein